MDRHEAYKLLSRTLDRYKALPFADLEALVGSRRSERARTQSGEEFLLDVAFEWLDARTRRLRIVASADSPSTFRMERMEEQVVVSDGAA